MIKKFIHRDFFPADLDLLMELGRLVDEEYAARGDMREALFMGHVCTEENSAYFRSGQNLEKLGYVWSDDVTNFFISRKGYKLYRELKIRLN